MEKPIDTLNVGIKLDKVEELAQQRVVDITVEEAASVVMGKGKQLFLCRIVRMIESMCLNCSSLCITSSFCQYI
jgi:hypothetical protein